MGIVFRKRIRTGQRTAVNLSARGASVSTRSGRVTLSSRGRVSVRLLPGLSLRFGGRR